MPLVKSKSPAAVGRNIRTLTAEGRKPAQAIAIALDVQRRAGGGSPTPTEDKPEEKQPPRKRVPARDGMAKRLQARIARGGAL